MTWLVDQIHHKALILAQVQGANIDGSMEQQYKQLARIWVGIDPISSSTSRYIRNVQINDAPTHKVICRKSVQMGIDIDGDGFLKVDNFIFVLSSHHTSSGNLHRILSGMDVKHMDEYFELLVKDMGFLDTTRHIIT